MNNTKLKYGDIWRDEGNERYPQLWNLQVVQDVLGIMQNIPIRIFIPSRAREFADVVSSEFGDHINIFEIPNVNNALELLSDNTIIQNKLARPDPLPWLTRSSFDYPLWEALMSWPRWKALDTWFSLATFLGSNKRKEQPVTISTYFFDWLLIGYKTIKIGTHKDAILLAGPIPHSESSKFLTIDSSTLTHWTEEISQYLTESPNWISQQISLQISARPPINNNALKQELIIVSKAIERASNITWTDEQPPPILGRSTCSILARLAWAYESKFQDEVIGKIKRKQLLTGIFDKDTTITAIKTSSTERRALITIPQSERLQDNFSGRPSRWYGSLIFRSDSQGSWTLSPYHKNQKHNIGELKPPWVEEAVLYESNLETHRYDYFQGSLLRLRDRLQREFGIISSRGPNKNNSNKNSVDKLANFLAKNILQILHADIVTLEAYDYSTEALECNSVYTTDPYDSKRAFESNDLLISAKTNRSDYMNYRIIDAGEAKFCLAYGKWRKSDPPSERFRTPYKTIGKTIHSLLGVPLRAYGRTFGVIMVGGYTPYQFSNSDFRFAGWISEAVGYYLFRRRVLTRIEEMISIVLDDDVAELNRYHKICNALSDIFLSHSATLWQPERNKPNRFVPVGWDNRSDLGLLRADKPKQTRVVASDNYSALGCAIKKMKSQDLFTCIRLEELWSDLGQKNWIGNKAHRKHLTNEKITWVVAIPITTVEFRAENTNPISWLCLYYKHDGTDVEPLSKLWQPTVRFVREQVAILLASMHNQNERERQWQRIISHEVKQKVDSVKRVADKIIKWNKRNINNSGNEALNLWQEDLLCYTKDVHRLIRIIQDKELIRSARAEGYNPLFAVYEKLITSSKVEVVNFRKLFMHTLNQANQVLTKKGVTHETKNNWKTHPPYIEIQPSMIKDILRNLVDNAVKYSLPGTYIDARTDSNEFEFNFYLTNLTQLLGKRSPSTLANEGIRGKNVGQEEGEGLGLYLTRGYCELCNVDFSIDVDEIEHQEKLCSRFMVKLSFPASIIKKTR